MGRLLEREVAGENGEGNVLQSTTQRYALPLAMVGCGGGYALPVEACLEEGAT